MTPIEKLCMRDLETRQRGGPDGYRAAVVKAMKRPGTASEISKRSGVQRGTVVRWLRILRQENECFVFDWERTSGRGGDLKAIYRLGKGENKPKPARLSLAEYERNRRQHLKEKGVPDPRNAKRRTQRMVERAMSSPDIFKQALFNPIRLAS